MNQLFLILAGATFFLIAVFTVLVLVVGAQIPIHRRQRRLVWTPLLFIPYVGIMEISLWLSGSDDRLNAVFLRFGIGAFGLTGICALLLVIRFARLLRRLPSRETLARVEQLVREKNLATLEAELQQEIAELGPTDDRLAILGGSLSRLQKWEEALELFHELNQREQTGGVYLALEGSILCKVGRDQEGRALLDEACRKNPRDPLAPMRYSQVYADAGELSAAADALSRAEKLFAPYRGSRGAWRLGWVKLLADTRDKLERAQQAPGSARG